MEALCQAGLVHKVVYPWDREPKEATMGTQTAHMRGEKGNCFLSLEVEGGVIYAAIVQLPSAKLMAFEPGHQDRGFLASSQWTGEDLLSFSQ